MHVLGIDPGIERTGFAVLEMKPRGAFSVLDFGCILTDKKLPTAARLQSLAQDLKEIVSKWKPVAAGIEQVFFSKNVKTAMKVSHARGVIMETLEDHGVSIFEFNPSHIKMAVCGHGRADKHEVKKMIQYTLGIHLKNDDTADAIACGICLVTTHRNEIA